MKIATEFAVSTDGMPKLFFLPGYSPELNPDEWVRKNVTHDRVGKTGIKSAHGGSRGTAVATLQDGLAALGYEARRTGTYDDATRHAVTAFQKVHGLPRTGVADPAAQRALSTAERPIPRDTTISRHFEVDIARQVAYLVDGGVVQRIYDASTGASPDQSTPTGAFRVQYQINGWRYARLGALYRPSYFNHDGIAFHGGEDVTSTPAGHGCVRLTNAVIEVTSGPVPRCSFTSAWQTAGMILHPVGYVLMAGYRAEP